MNDTKQDMQRAIELATIVNNADQSGKYATIKTKSGRHCYYHTQAPAVVEAEARELQAIRRKHQDDNTFDFYKCYSYKKEICEDYKDDTSIYGSFSIYE